MAQRCDNGCNQVEDHEHTGPPQMFEDRSETPENEHVDGQVPDLAVRKGGGHQRPYQTVHQMCGADQKIGQHEIPETRHDGRSLPPEKDEHIDGDNHRHRRRPGPSTPNRRCSFRIGVCFLH